MRSHAVPLITIAVGAVLALGGAPAGAAGPAETPREKTLYEDGPDGRYLLGGRWLYADYKAGDVAIHSPHIVHASLDTQTDMMRMSVDIRFLPTSVEPDPRWLTKWAGDDGN